ncbi:group II intron maturase-specific domain-containing protein [Micromonospora globispora]|uniref:group II intron maturase-specific domain-containing protein n=1 Tax=Micromonospora globispora TaxID=1450148 RepID=UPI0034D96DE9
MPAQRQPAAPDPHPPPQPGAAGWCAHFRPGVAAATFADLASYALDRFLRWARRKHRRP